MTRKLLYRLRWIFFGMCTHRFYNCHFPNMTGSNGTHYLRGVRYTYTNCKFKEDTIKSLLIQISSRCDELREDRNEAIRNMMEVREWMEKRKGKGEGESIWEWFLELNPEVEGWFEKVK